MSAQDSQDNKFHVSSTTFENNTTLPLSMIYNYQVNGVNICSINGAPGGDESPQLAWTNAPSGTRSFAVTTFDVTAGVVHWGMYNISPATNELPENAGVTGSTYGQQVINTYGSAGSNADMNYGGPCPPLIIPRMSTIMCSPSTLSTRSSDCLPPRISRQPPFRFIGRWFPLESGAISWQGRVSRAFTRRLPSRVAAQITAVSNAAPRSQILFITGWSGS